MAGRGPIGGSLSVGGKRPVNVSSTTGDEGKAEVSGELKGLIQTAKTSGDPRALIELGQALEIRGHELILEGSQNAVDLGKELHKCADDLLEAAKTCFPREQLGSGDYTLAGDGEEFSLADHVVVNGELFNLADDFDPGPEGDEVFDPSHTKAPTSKVPDDSGQGEDLPIPGESGQLRRIGSRPKPGRLKDRLAKFEALARLAEKGSARTGPTYRPSMRRGPEVITEGVGHGPEEHETKAVKSVVEMRAANQVFSDTVGSGATHKEVGQFSEPRGEESQLGRVDTLTGKAREELVGKELFKRPPGPRALKTGDAPG